MTPSPNTLRVATYNIHKGVQGIGPRKRLEIHNLGHAVEQLDVDIVCLQEVRKLHRRQAMYFTQWPELEQADGLKLLGLIGRKRDLALQLQHDLRALTLLRLWLFIHVPVTFALLASLVIHIIVVFLYR